jgi:hypothetical protein
VTIALGAALSGAVDISKYAHGIVIIPSGWTTADLGIQVAASEAGTYVPLKDRLNQYGTDASIDAVAASSAYPLPSWVFAAGWIKLWSHNGAGVGVNQDAARTLTLLLKS